VAPAIEGAVPYGVRPPGLRRLSLSGPRVVAITTGDTMKNDFPAAPAATAIPNADPPTAARAAGLRYVHDDRPGIRRESVDGPVGAFRYLDAHNQPVEDEATLKRIRALAIPPAYTDVWICPHANGHLQATGRDARGRKQYRYHAKWRAVRDDVKYERMIKFGKALPTIRKEVDRALSLPWIFTCRLRSVVRP
jgi:DNA topoisomerase-1